MDAAFCVRLIRETFKLLVHTMPLLQLASLATTIRAQDTVNIGGNFVTVFTISILLIIVDNVDIFTRITVNEVFNVLSLRYVTLINVIII